MPDQDDEAADRPNIFPALRYEDASAAIKWLCDAFGFHEKLIVEGEAGSIAHAELRLGSGIVMLGSAKEDGLGKSPGRQGEVSSVVYICVTDADAHCKRAKEAGAEVLRELADTDYGSREYTVRDLEGHVWSFGTYDPTASTD